MKKTSVFIASILIFLTSLLSVSCVRTEKRVVKESDEFLVIFVTQSQQSNQTLLSYMQNLSSCGEIEFTQNDGMITSINGIQNKSDWSKAWMLYTTDEDNYNESWGIIEYDGKTYCSALYGANQLVVKQGESYIWLYQSL